MPTCCPDTLLQRLCASSVTVCTGGVRPPSATSEVYSGDGATTVSLSHPLWPQLHIRCLCPGGSAADRELAVQENVSQGLHDAQNHYQSCQCKAQSRSAGTWKQQLQGEQMSAPSPPLQNRQHTCIFTSHQQADSGALSPQVLHQQSASDSTCLQICTDRVDGMTCLINVVSFSLHNKRSTYTTFQ